MMQFFVNFVRALLFVVLQVWVVNRIQLFGWATPVLYIYPILHLPFFTSSNHLILLSFVVGFVMDLLCGTPGINSFCLLMSAFLRLILLPILNTKGVADIQSPSIYSLGALKYIFYLFTIAFIHILLLYLLDALTFTGFGWLLLKVAASAGLTILNLLPLQLFSLRSTR